jgi:hypothetical protein
MSTAGGPRLEGIGRSGDSDIVLCMDAQDAGSYPGEPTTNYIKHTADGIPVGWWGDGSNQSIGTKGAVDITDNNLKYNGYPTILWTPGDSYNGYLNGTADIDQTALSTVWTFSCYVKAEDDGTLKTSGNDLFMYFYRGTGSYPSDSGTGTVVDAGDGWYRLSLSVSGTSNYTGLIGFSNFRAGARFYLSGAQLEKKSYPTPFVTGFTNSGEVYDGRPASINLMIHGDVGSGQTFSDSSPSKHTITTVGNTTHSAAQSKFSGGSVYFDGTGDKLTPASSSDFAFGTGDFTVDCWLYKTATSSWETLFDTYSAGGYNGFICGLYDSNSQMAFYSEGGVGWVNAAGQVLSLNTWYHLAWVRSGNNLRMFVDGVQQTNVTLSSSDNYTSPYLDIGSRVSAQYITGYMDEMRITKGTALWTSAFTPPTRRNRSAPVVDLSGSDTGGNFSTKDMTDVATYRDGQVIEPVGSAIWDFDNTDDVITLGPSSGFGISDTVSIFAWIKLDSTSGWNGVFGTYDGGNFIHFQIYLGRMNVYLYGATAAYDGDDAASYLSAGEWSHVGFTFGSDTLTVYVHGEEMPTQKSGNGNPVSTTTAVSIGRVYSSGRMFNGQMGNVQVYKTTLTAQQVKQNFNSQRSRFKV